MAQGDAGRWDGIPVWIPNEDEQEDRALRPVQVSHLLAVDSRTIDRDRPLSP
ncbi:hypothetical protein ACFVFJ_47775 [Streptomyces sp. NPDC057717]|uniref:hypothetical protein n=1 Tax=Streptomyces sp. NPDC057717 TaxID=3346224 RepID=UPI0036834713